MKRIVLLILSIAICLSLAGCQKYEPQESSALERTTVATLKYEGKSYKVNYELFRMLFLSAKEVASEGDLTRFEGAEAEALLSKARDIALDKLYEIYSVLSLCEKLGIDLYSRTVDKKVEESITVSIEGGYAETGEFLEGTGSYERYLESLKLFYANYAVQDLMIRYSYGVSAISAHYRGTLDEYGLPSSEGALTYTDEDITSYYNSNDTRRILRVFLQRSEDKVQQLCDRIALLSSEEEVSALMIGESLGNDVDARIGLVIGEHSWDNSSYAELTAAAFGLEVGEVAMVAGRLGGYDGYFVLYRAQKSAANLAAGRAQTETMYIENEIGKRYAEVKAKLKESASFTDFYKQLVLADISMSEEEK